MPSIRCTNPKSTKPPPSSSSIPSPRRSTPSILRPTTNGTCATRTTIRSSKSCNRDSSHNASSEISTSPATLNSSNSTISPIPNSSKNESLPPIPSLSSSQNSKSKPSSARDSSTFASNTKTPNTPRCSPMPSPTPIRLKIPNTAPHRSPIPTNLSINNTKKTSKNSINHAMHSTTLSKITKSSTPTPSSNKRSPIKGSIISTSNASKSKPKRDEPETCSKNSKHSRFRPNTSKLLPS